MWLFDYIKAEAATVMKAPFLLFAVLALGAVLGWGAAKTFYEQDLQTLRDQLAPYLEPKIPVEVASPASSPTPNVLETQVRNVEESANAEIAKLKAENARLKNRPTRTIIERPAPSACPSQPIFPQFIKLEDCNALTGAQRLLDNADEQRREAIRTLALGQLKSNEQINQVTMQGLSAKNTEDEAATNLRALYDRLCMTVRYTSPSPTP
jgi:hypothetical protein